MRKGRTVTETPQNPTPDEVDDGPVHEEPDTQLAAVPEGAKDTGRYAVYDRRFARYLPGVSEKGADKPKIGDVKPKDRPASDYAVVEV